MTPSADLPAELTARLASGLALRTKGYRGRFAPSPTGPLHLGNLRTALLGWLDARLQGGEWILRIDDLDLPRNRPEAVDAILADLDWLGLNWDGPVLFQSSRRGLYATTLSWLRRGGRLYPCHCSRRMLADVSAPHGASPVYPGFCRRRPPHWGEIRGRLPSWRLRLGPSPLCWSERFAGEGRLDGPAEVGDVILRRADGLVAYHLATAVDELLLGITDVVRGEDLWWATAAQVAVMKELGAEPPRYGHVPLWCDLQGRRLSKRLAGEGLQAWREEGLDPAGAIGRLAASLELVPRGTRLSARELLESLEASGFERRLRGGSEA